MEDFRQNTVSSVSTSRSVILHLFHWGILCWYGRDCERNSQEENSHLSFYWIVTDDFQRPFSDWSVLNGISVTITSSLIADSAALPITIQ